MTEILESKNIDKYVLLLSLWKIRRRIRTGINEKSLLINIRFYRYVSLMVFEILKYLKAKVKCSSFSPNITSVVLVGFSETDVSYFYKTEM